MYVYEYAFNFGFLMLYRAIFGQKKKTEKRKQKHPEIVVNALCQYYSAVAKERRSIISCVKKESFIKSIGFYCVVWLFGYFKVTKKKIKLENGRRDVNPYKRT